MRNIAIIRIFQSLSILLLFSGCDDSSIDPENVMEEENTYSFTYDAKNYTLVKQTSTWEDAVTYAVESGGYLAEINSEEEQIAIFIALAMQAGITFDETNNQFGYAAIWLGGNDLGTEGVWVWNGNNDETEQQFWEGGVNGSVVNGLYNNWGNEPDNNGDQDVLCIGLEATPINEAGKWTDLDGTNNHLFFLIEYD